MRDIFDPQRYIKWTSGSPVSKIVAEYQEKFNRLGEILDENPRILEIAAGDLSKLSVDSEDGREATYTCENLLRLLLVHQIEGLSLRGTEVHIAMSPFLQDFVRLGTRAVPSYRTIGRAVKVMQPETWKAINDALTDVALEEGKLDPSRLRVDTTVVEGTIHYPTDSSLLWDSWRVLYRLISRIREEEPGLVFERFHEAKAKKHHLFITRYLRSSSRKRQRHVRKHQRKFLKCVEHVLGCAERLRDVLPQCLGETVVELYRFVPLVKRVLAVAKRAWLEGETVPAAERIFSIFEPHVELIKRGRRHKPVEFGHMVLLGQSAEKFITQYEVMEKKIPDCRLPETILERHQERFGELPRELVADKGFCGKPEEMASLRERVKVLGIPQRLRDWAQEGFAALQRFRAGIEGSISVLKRAFGLLRCQYRSFKTFASHVGLAVFAHNLVLLTRMT